MKILVAGDNSNTVMAYKQALEYRGHIVISTANGQHCLKVYNDRLHKIALHSDLQELEQPFDVVILDFKLSQINGLQVARAILAVSPHQRIILASAYVKDTAKGSVESLNRGIEILPKPFSEQALIDAVEDKPTYSELSEMNINIEVLKKANLRHEQLRDLLRILKEARRKNHPQPANSRTV